MYDLLSPGFTGRCTAPLLVDTKARRAVCNESSLIVRNLAQLARPLPAGTAGSGAGSAASNDAASSSGGGGRAVDLYPAELRLSIDSWNDKIYDTGALGIRGS